jgi:trk system potassium uptake protein TrkA
LGLGSFGSTLARRLSENGCRVTGVDYSEKLVAEAQQHLYEAIVGNVTDRETLEQLNVHNAIAVFISLGEDIEQSILAALHAKELGARQVYVKGVTRDHAKILEKLGVDRVIFPEAEIAVQVADKATWPNVLDFLQIDPEYRIVEIAAPNALLGQTLGQADLRRRFGVYIVGIKDALTGRLAVMPHADMTLTDDQILLVIGKHQDLERFRELQ